MINSLVYKMIVAHYIKRIIETLFIHKFSNATMPLKNLPKNCFHYYVLGGFLVARSIYSSKFTYNCLQDITKTQYFLSGIFLFAELSNLKTHLTLAGLRKNSQERKIPYGYGFNKISCANYFFEIVAWTALCLITKNLWSK
jgi:very-long-chain enoyl-CoA reductase